MSDPLENLTILKVISGLGGLGSIGSIITGLNTYWNSREKPKLYRNPDQFDEYNRVFGPRFFESPEFCYAYLTFCLINERKKLLIKEINCSIFNYGEQKWVSCEIITAPPSAKYGSSGERLSGSPGAFPNQYQLIGLLNQREIPEKSARDYFLALKFPGFAINNLEGRSLKSLQDEFGSQNEFDLRIIFTTSSNKKHFFKTKLLLFNLKDTTT
ncbi:MAG: hypothetical protein IPJ69_05565 [Deltaproteobacteria bacterium]|nr:MAG: hypothetical protein IPJ69_05565 [Deltaproteobacteria bacterium]